MVDKDMLRWLNTLRLTHRLKLKCVPLSIRNALVEERLARITGKNLVITAAGLRGSRHPQPRMAAYIYVN